MRLFDNAGNLLISQVSHAASDIWNAGSEAFNQLNAAFLAIGNNDLRTPENGVVGFNFAELAGFNGLTTAAGYIFQSNLTAGTPIGTHHLLRHTSAGARECGNTRRVAWQHGPGNAASARLSK